MNTDQLSFADAQVSLLRKATKTSRRLMIFDEVIDWASIVALVKVVDKTDSTTGGRPHADLGMLTRMLFVQYLYNLSDEELEEHLHDRLTFQRFCGITMEMRIPDHTTIWRFKESLIREGVMEKMFAMILSQLQSQGVRFTHGRILDATIIDSSHRPLRSQEREVAQEHPSPQKDMDARSGKKYGRFRFGYKGHVSVDVGTKIITNHSFTAANVHDSIERDALLDGSEQAVYGDNAYDNYELCDRMESEGRYYGIRSQPRGGKPLTQEQQVRNKAIASIRSRVEHVFSYLKNVLHHRRARARTKERNELRFTMTCIVYNILRTGFIRKSMISKG
jgi:IS5 family transposase